MARLSREFYTGDTVEIARALLFDAKLLILDEPTTGLHNEEIDRLFMLLRRMGMD